MLSDVILLNLKKSHTPDGQNIISIVNNDNKCEIKQAAYLANKNFNFSAISDFDVELFRKIYSIPHLTLQNSQWGLGIVTGNNKNIFLNIPTIPKKKYTQGKRF